MMLVAVTGSWFARSCFLSERTSARRSEGQLQLIVVALVFSANKGNWATIRPTVCAQLRKQAAPKICAKAQPVKKRAKALEGSAEMITTKGNALRGGGGARTGTGTNDNSNSLVGDGDGDKTCDTAIAAMAAKIRRIRRSVGRPRLRHGDHEGQRRIPLLRRRTGPGLTRVVVSFRFEQSLPYLLTNETT
jgi:hypothetical protein